MTLDFSRCRLPPFQHQREDTAWLVERPYALIGSEPRTGKTKIIIDAAQFLHERGAVDRVIVVAPAPVRDVWYDRQFGEIQKHRWTHTRVVVFEFHARCRQWIDGPDGVAPLQWIVTNYEFLGAGRNVEALFAMCGPTTWLVLDESSFVKSHAAARTKACAALRARCGRVTLLNGTPIFHSPLDLFSQGNLLHPSILDCKFITKYKARYAIQEPLRGAGGKVITSPWGAVQKITGWTNLDDLQRRFAPVTVRRLQKDCLDLPPKLDAVVLTATLSKATWRAYKDMRDDLVVWLSQRDIATAGTAAIKVLRLSQITSGFLSGIEDARIGEDPLDAGLLESLVLPTYEPGGAGVSRSADDAAERTPGSPTTEIGREKLDVLLWFIEQQLAADPNAKIVVWHRFRPEQARTLREVAAMFPQITLGSLCGGQPKDERRHALSLLKPETAPSGPVLVAGTAGTGSFGLDFTAAHICVTMSCGYSPGQAAQMLDRVYGPGQTSPVAYYEIVATGPQGERTIDHAILAARRAGETVAAWTSAAWVRALQGEP